MSKKCRCEKTKKVAMVKSCSSKYSKSSCKKPEVSEKSDELKIRRCFRCGGILSRYNKSNICYPCNSRRISELW